MKPKIGKLYYFVRKKNEKITFTEFTRHADGSGGFVADGFYSMHENHPDAWEDAILELEQMGFIEMKEAMSQGIIPDSWQPVPELNEANIQGEVKVEPTQTKP